MVQYLFLFWGCPRSGTTLVEQIITSHSQVSAGGELNYVSRFGKRLSVGEIIPNKTNLCEFRKRYFDSVSYLTKRKALYYR